MRLFPPVLKFIFFGVLLSTPIFPSCVFDTNVGRINCLKQPIEISKEQYSQMSFQERVDYDIENLKWILYGVDSYRYLGIEIKVLYNSLEMLSGRWGYA